MLTRHTLRDEINRSTLPGVARSVLRHIVERATGEGGRIGEAWPSVADVVACTGFGRTAVKAALAQLRQLGWLVDTGERRSQCVVYAITVGPDRLARGHIVAAVALAWWWSMAPSARSGDDPQRAGGRPGRETTGSGDDPGEVGRRPGRETTGSGDDPGEVGRRPGGGRETTQSGSRDDHGREASEEVLEERSPFPPSTGKVIRLEAPEASPPTPPSRGGGLPPDLEALVAQWQVRGIATRATPLCVQSFRALRRDARRLRLWPEDDPPAETVDAMVDRLRVRYRAAQTRDAWQAYREDAQRRAYMGEQLEDQPMDLLQYIEAVRLRNEDALCYLSHDLQEALDDDVVADDVFELVGGLAGLR